MILRYKNKDLAIITTNKSLSIKDALFIHGYDLENPEDCEKAYNDGFAAAYIDDEGNYQIDTDGLEMVY